MRWAIEPAPPSTMFSCEPPSIENSVLMLPCARTRNSRWSNEMSSRSPVNSPRTAISNRSRATVVRIPERSSHHATERESHSAARSAVHGRVERHALGHPVDLHLGQRDRHDGEGADLRDQTRVAPRSPVVDEQVRALDPGLVGGDADLGGQAEDRIVPGRQPRPTPIDRRPVGQVVSPDPAADPIAGLEHDHRGARLTQPQGRGQPGVPGAHDAHVRLDALRGDYGALLHLARHSGATHGSVM